MRIGDIVAPEAAGDVVYRIEMGPVEAAGIRRGKDQDVPADLAERLTGNIIEVARPRRWMLDSRFVLIEVVCAFLPAEGQQIIWARLAASLATKDGAPEIHDLFPIDVHDDSERETSVSVGLDFKFGFELDAGRRVTTIRYKKLEPRLIATPGKNRREPAWTFSRTTSADVAGCRPLYMIVRVPHAASSLDLRFALLARARTRWGIIPLTRNKVLSGNERISLPAGRGVP